MIQQRGKGSLQHGTASAHSLGSAELLSQDLLQVHKVPCRSPAVILPPDKPTSYSCSSVARTCPGGISAVERGGRFNSGSTLVTCSTGHWDWWLCEFTFTLCW